MKTSVLVWTLKFPKNLSPLLCRRWVSLLGPNEKKRLKAMQSSHRKTEYILGHALLRLALARQFKVEPSRTPLQFIGQKPVIKGRRSWHASLAHTRGIVLCALSPCPIGIDVEGIRPKLKKNQIAKRYFSKSMQDIFFRLSVKKRTKKFYEMWTLSESFYKASGFNMAEIENKIFFSDWQFFVRELTGKIIFGMAIHTPGPLSIKDVYLDWKDFKAFMGGRCNHIRLARHTSTISSIILFKSKSFGV